jgi:PAS domain S-box-containing protein
MAEENVCDSIPIEVLTEIVQDPLLVLDAELYVKAANSAFCHLFHLSASAICGQDIYALTNLPWDRSQLQTLLEEEVRASSQVDRYVLNVKWDQGPSSTLYVNARSVGNPPLILLTFSQGLAGVQDRTDLADSILSDIMSSPFDEKMGIPSLYREVESVANLNSATINIAQHKEIKSILEERALQQAAIAELGQQALTGRDLNTLMQNAVSLVASILDVEYVKVVELLPGGDDLLLRAGTGWKPEYRLNETRINTRSMSQSGFTLASNRPVIVKEMDKEIRFQGSPMLLDHEVISGMSVVIGGRHAPYGVLGVHTCWRRSFSEDQVNFLQSVANLLAMAIERREAEVQQMRLLAEVRSAHAEAEHERKRLYDLFMEVPAAVSILQGPNHLYQLANLAHRRLTDNDNLIGRSVRDAHFGIQEQGYLAILDRIYQAGESFSSKEMAVTVYSEDGEAIKEIFINTVLHPILDAMGSVTGIFTHAIDVTEQVNARRQIEELAAERERNLAQMQAIFHNVTKGLVIADPDGFVLEMNPAALTLHGFEDGGEAQLHLGDYTSLFELYTIEGESVPLEAWPLARVLREQTFQSYEVRVKYKNTGSEWIASYSGSPVYDKEGNFIFAVLTISDTTEEKEAEQALLASEERLRLAVEAGAIGIWDIDLRQGSRSWSDRALAIHGLSPADTLSLEKQLALIHPDDREMVRQAVHEFRDLAIRDTLELQHRILWPDGRVRWVSVRGEANDEGIGSQRRRVRLVGTIIDITDRVEAEQALLESEVRFRGTFENAAVGISHVDITGKWLRVNQRLCEILGYSEEELLSGMHFQDITYPDDLAADLESLERLVRGEIQEYQMEKRYYHKAGHIVWGQLTVALQRDERGEPLYCITVTEDITKRKQMEDALRQSEVRFRVMAETLPDILFTCQPNGSIDYINSRFSDYTGRQPVEALGTKWTAFVHPEDIVRYRQHWQHSLVHGLTFENEFRIRTAAGDFRWFVGRAHPIHNDQGEVERWVGTCTDIQDRKVAEEALRHSEQELRLFNENLEERVQRRTRQVRELASALTLAEQRERRRVSQILHDHVQQMLYGIQMRNHLLKLDAEIADQVAVKEHVRVMEQLVEQAIRATRSLSVEMSPPVLKNEGLAAAIEWLAGNMREIHGLTVETDLRSDYQPASEDLRVLVFQVTRELLFNVVKHADVNSARLEMYELDGKIFVRVMDEGIGFDVATIEHTEDKLEGGLGLYSIQERLALFGGHLAIESTVAKGTVATIVVPCQPRMPSWQGQP